MEEAAAFENDCCFEAPAGTGSSAFQNDCCSDVYEEIRRMPRRRDRSGADASATRGDAAPNPVPPPLAGHID